MMMVIPSRLDVEHLSRVDFSGKTVRGVVESTIIMCELYDDSADFPWEIIRIELACVFAIIQL